MTDFVAPSLRRSRTRFGVPHRLIATGLLPLALTGLMAAAPARAQEIGPGALMQELIALDATSTRAPGGGVQPLPASSRAGWDAGPTGRASSPAAVPVRSPRGKELSATPQVVESGTSLRVVR